VTACRVALGCGRGASVLYPLPSPANPRAAPTVSSRPPLSPTTPPPVFSPSPTRRPPQLPPHPPPRRQQLTPFAATGSAALHRPVLVEVRVSRSPSAPAKSCIFVGSSFPLSWARPPLRSSGSGGPRDCPVPGDAPGWGGEVPRLRGRGGVIKLEEGAALIGTRGETGGAARGDRSIRKARSE